MDNSMEKRGLDWSNLWSLRMLVEQRDTYGNDYGAQARVVLIKHKYNSQLAIQTYGTTLWCDKCERTK